MGTIDSGKMMYDVETLRNLASRVHYLNDTLQDGQIRSSIKELERLSSYWTGKDAEATVNKLRIELERMAYNMSRNSYELANRLEEAANEYERQIDAMISRING